MSYTYQNSKKYADFYNMPEIWSPETTQVQVCNGKINAPSRWWIYKEWEK